MVIDPHDLPPGAAPRRSASAAALRARLRAMAPPRGHISARAQPPMLATLAGEPFTADGWLFEIKYDGVRVLAERRGDWIELRGRSGQIVTARYPEVAAALRALPVSEFLLDGELVAFDEEGRPSFQRLQTRMGLADPRDVAVAAARVDVTGVFFDCPSLDGYDLRQVALVDRKQCLALALAGAPPALRYSDHVAREGRAFHEAVCERGLEGTVAKRGHSPYVGGRSRDWIKVKCHRRETFVIGGYTDPQGGRAYFGALHLGRYVGDRLVYVSKVGGGFDQRSLRTVWEALRPLARATSPFDEGTPAGRGHHWVEPRLMCEVRFSEWTRDGGIRHPLFLGLRPEPPSRERRCSSAPPPEASDRSAATSLESTPHGEPTPAGEASRRDEPTLPSGEAQRARAGIRQAVKSSSSDALLWPADGYTKRDLVAYYEGVAPLVLPYLRDRPVVLRCYPDGITGPVVVERHAPDSAPAGVRRHRVPAPSASSDVEHLLIDDADGLRYVASLGAIQLDVESARVSDPERPDWLALDLDANGAPFADVVRAARALRNLLDDLGLPSCVKTSGATGLHILLPLGARYHHDDAASFARLLALLGEHAAPDLATAASSLGARGRRVHIDAGPNGAGKTIAAPFAVLPLPGAPVSCPLDWDEVTAGLDPARFTIRSVLDRFGSRPDPLAPVLGDGIDIGAALARVEARFGGSPTSGAAPRGRGRKPGPFRPPRA